MDKNNLKDKIEHIIKLRNQGLTLEQIGKKFGVTKQAISLVLIDAGIKDKDRPSDRFLKVKYKTEANLYKKHLKKLIKSIYLMCSTESKYSGSFKYAKKSLDNSLKQALHILSLFEERSNTELEKDFMKFKKNLEIRHNAKR